MSNKKIKNINIKIISLVIAIFIWGFVSLFVNPEITRKFNNIPVIIHNSEVLQGKGLEILTEIKDSVNITIKGKRTSIAKTDKADITAYIDASTIKSGKKAYQIKYSLPYDDLHITAQSIDEIKLEADKIIDKRVSVRLNKEGRNPNVRSVWLDDYQLTIKGISKNVKQVERIEIDFNISGIKGSKKYSIGYKLVDKNGKELDIKPKEIGLSEVLTVNVSAK